MGLYRREAREITVYASVSPNECRGVVRRSGEQGGELAHQEDCGLHPTGSIVIPGARTTARLLSESPEAVEASGVWAVAVLRSFLNAALGSDDMVDIRVAAGAALQDLDELQGVAEYDEPLGETA